MINRKSIAFFVFPVLRFPRNNREYYLTKELFNQKWKIKWLVPKGYRNEGVPINKFILQYFDIKIRGRTYLLPLYIGWILWKEKINYLWLSGWSIRSEKEIFWLIKILSFYKVRVVYDPIDPKCIFDEANKNIEDSNELERCYLRMNKIYEKCYRIICVTPEMKSLLNSKGADESKLFVARWGTDINIFNQNAVKYNFRHLHNINDDTILLGWMGSMTRFKGIMEMLIPLVERFLNRSDIQFFIAGDGPLYSEVEKWAISNINSNSITLLGRIAYHDAAEFTASLDCYIVPTKPDTEYARAICPVKCYDAVAMGTKLVTTRTKATEHLVDLSNNVYLCEYDIDSFEIAINKAIKNRNLFQSRSTYNYRDLPCHQFVSKILYEMIT